MLLRAADVTHGGGARWGGLQLFCLPGASEAGTGKGGKGAAAANGANEAHGQQQQHQQHQLLSDWSSAANTVHGTPVAKAGGAGWSQSSLRIVTEAAPVSKQQPRPLHTPVRTVTASSDVNAFHMGSAAFRPCLIDP